MASLLGSKQAKLTRQSTTSKVISLFDTKQREGSRRTNVMGQTAERRIEERQPCQSRLFVQITACDEPDLVGTTFSCHTQDVSPGGLCITSEAYVPAGAKLDLWVENGLRPGKYFLTGDVRWVAPLDGSRCALGLELQESPTTDIELWRQDH